MQRCRCRCTRSCPGSRSPTLPRNLKTSPPRWQRKMSATRLVKAVHGLRSSAPDEELEYLLVTELRQRLNREQLSDTYTRFSAGLGYVDTLLRRASLRGLAKRVGDGLSLGRNVCILHPE